MYHLLHLEDQFMLQICGQVHHQILPADIG